VEKPMIQRYVKPFFIKCRDFIIGYLKRLLAKNKDFLISEGHAAKGFMHLLFKHRNTGEKWTKEEIREIKQHLKTLALAVPALIIFLPPGGSILLPILVDVLDRRNTVRRKPPAGAPAVPKEKCASS
jgi:hypothetical protein